MKKQIYILALAGLLTGAASCIGPDFEPVSGLQDIIINEISPAADDSENGWIEIMNTSSSAKRIYGLKVQISDSYYYHHTVYDAPDITLEPGQRMALTSGNELNAPLRMSDLEEVALSSASDTIITSIDVKALVASGKPAEGGSWSRIPDMSGDFIITETATKGEKNYKFVPYKVDGLILNEICPSEGWVEIINNALGALKLDETAIVLTDYSDYDHELYKFDENTDIKRYERVVVPVTIMDMKLLKLVSNEGKVVDTFSVSDVRDAGSIAAGNSYSRLPDTTGDWYISGTSTKEAVNQDSSADIARLVLNEVCLAEGWLEVCNPTVRTLQVGGATISVDGKTVVTLSGSMKPGESKAYASAGVSASSEIALKNSSGVAVDTFKAADSKDGDVPATAGSWSRIPDGKDWYTVKTSSKDASNYGIIKGNTVGVWYNQSNTPNLLSNLDQFAKRGIGHVLLHEYAFKYYENLIPSILEKAESLGISIHIWMQCFWWNDNQGVNGWRSPVIDSLKCYDQALFDDILGPERAQKYVKAGVKGIHFDYIRFGGTAYKHDFPEANVTGQGAIDEFCRQADEKLRAINPDLILSAALMGETGSEKYYGQHPESMSQYIDILIPMLYFHSGGYNGATAAMRLNWFANHAGPNTQVWAGIQTYDANSNGLPDTTLRQDFEAFVGSKASGVSFFRHGLGSLPVILDLQTINK